MGSSFVAAVLFFITVCELTTAQLYFTTSGVEGSFVDNEADPHSPVPNARFAALLARVEELEGKVNVCSTIPTIANANITCSTSHVSSCVLAPLNGTAYLSSSSLDVACSLDTGLSYSPIYAASGCKELLVDRGANPGVYTFTTEYGTYDLECFNDATYGDGWSRFTSNFLSTLNTGIACTGVSLANPESLAFTCDYNAAGEALHCGCSLYSSFKVFFSEVKGVVSPATTSAAGSKAPNPNFRLYDSFPEGVLNPYYDDVTPVCSASDCLKDSVSVSTGTTFALTVAVPDFYFFTMGMKKYTSNPLNVDSYNVMFR